jgi:hypothetical protein
MPKLLLVAWAAFIILWFLPVVADAGELTDGPVPGWEAFKTAFHPSGGWVGDALSMASGLTNGVMLLSALVLVLRGTPKAVTWLGWALAVSAFLNSMWAWPGYDVELTSLLWGYWLWLGSFVLAAGVLLAGRKPTRPEPAPDAS